MFRRLDVVIRAWITRRLLWLWLFGYACVSTSAYLWPVSPRNNYFECPRAMIPGGALDLRDLPHLQRKRLTELRDIQALVLGRETLNPDLRGVKSSVGYLPELKAIYVSGYRSDPVGFRHLCEILPGIRVWHLDFNAGRLASTVFLLLATLILGGAVMQQASAAFSMPQARMYPRFIAPNVIVPLTICAAGIAVASLIARGYGTDPWAAASLQVFGWGIWSALEFLLLPLRRKVWWSRSARRTEAGTTELRLPLLEVGALVFVASALYFLALHIYVVESLLLGELLWVNAGLFIVGAGLGVGAVVLAPKLIVELGEAGVAPVLSMQDIEKRRPVPLLTSPFHRRLERLRRPHSVPTWLWRIRATRAGNPNLFSSALIKIVGPIGIAAVLECFFLPGQFGLLLALLLAVSGMMLALSSCFSTWWQRRKTFSVQLLYPWTRRQMIVSAFAAYGIDAASILVLLLAAVAAFPVAGNLYVSKYTVVVGALIVAASSAVLVTGGLWLLTLRHRLLASFLAFVGVVLVIAWVTFELQSVLAINSKTLGVRALSFLLFGTVLGLDAYQRWKRAEWGLFGPP